MDHLIFVESTMNKRIEERNILTAQTYAQTYRMFHKNQTINIRNNRIKVLIFAVTIHLPKDLIMKS